MTARIPTVLSIAGTDPTGCAGMMADIKTISALGGYALGVSTAIIAQNSDHVGNILIVPRETINAQLRAVTQAMPVMAIKIGLLPDIDAVEAVGVFLAAQEGAYIPVVVDPVLCASTGQSLVAGDVLPALRKKLFPYLDLITPNLDEMAQLLSCTVARSRDEMFSQARRLWEQGPFAVLLKGGHLADTTISPDLLITKEGKPHWYEEPRIMTVHDRGTGCTLSSALAFFLRDHDEKTAVSLARHYLRQSLQLAERLNLLPQKGPLNHFGYQPD